MKFRATILSMVTLGLFAVPVCSHAQGVDSSATFPLSSLLPSVPLQSASAHATGIPSLFLPDAGVFALSPSLNLPHEASARTAAPLPSLPITAVKTLSNGAPGSPDSTRSIPAVGGNNIGNPGIVISFGSSPTATPEPGTMALMIGGLFGGAVALRRRKK